MRRLKIALYAVIISLFFIPNFVRFVSDGENMFTVSVNGQEVGTVDNIDEAQSLLKTARKNVNAIFDNLTFAEVSMDYVGKEVIWGKVDSKEKVLNNMEMVIKNSIVESLVRAYEVKINGYLVTLKSKDEVVKLLQAAIDKYDTEGSFEASLVSDLSRELPVLVPMISSKEDTKQEEAIKEKAFFTAGFDFEMEQLFEQIEPDVEKDFEDYDLGIISMGFKDEVEVAEVYVNPKQITDLKAAIHEVTDEELNNEIYKVVSGDTLSGIALKVNIPMDDIIAMNDSLEDQNSTIRPDDELIITVPKPKLAVVRSEVMYYEENYTAETEYILNDDWYTTDRVTHRQPSDGHRKAVSVINFENNDKTDVEILKEEITCMPVAKLVEKGTKIPPTYIKPIYGGRLTSTFGYRNRPTKGASSYHKGVDWGTPVGTPVYASCGGTVAKAGWGSGYGYCIYINHPDGRSTRYGHLSKVLVSAGQQVSQGQKIALSGNTGVSTGPHLHFEILIGGSQVNPLKYVSQ